MKQPVLYAVQNGITGLSQLFKWKPECTVLIPVCVFSLPQYVVIKYDQFRSQKIQKGCSQWAPGTTRFPLCLWSRRCGNKGPATQPSQQALRLQPIRFQLSVHFKGMLASLWASSRAGSGRQTSHIFRPAEGTETERGSPFIRDVVWKHPVLLSYFLFYTQSQRVKGQSCFLWTSTLDWPCYKLKRGGGRSPEFQICLSVAWWTTEPPPLCFDTCLMHKFRVREDSCARCVTCCSALVLYCSGTHCSGQDADRTTYLNTHNSLLVCRTCDQSC